MQYFLERLCVRFNPRDPLGRKSIVQDYTLLLASIPDTMERMHWLGRLAEALGTEERIVAASVEEYLRANRVATPSASPPVSEVTPRVMAQNVLTRRSEVLRRRIVLAMVADKAIWQQMLIETTDDIRTFLAEDEDFVLLANTGEACGYDMNRLLAEVDDQPRKEQLAATFFESERSLEQEGFSIDDPEERKKMIAALVGNYLVEIGKELHKDHLLSLQREMTEARNTGDATREAELRREFSELLQRK